MSTTCWPTGPRRPPRAVGAALPQPQRAAVAAVAGPGCQRPAGRPGRGRVAGRGGSPGRLRLRPHGGPVRPGRGGGPDRRAPRPRVRPRPDARHQPAVRGHGHRPGPPVAGRPAGHPAGPPVAPAARRRHRRLLRRCGLLCPGPGRAGRPVTRPGSPAPDPAVLLELACAVALEAGELLRSGHGQVKVVQTKSSPTDVVTQMDQAAEELIRRRILAARPGDAILGEEGGQPDAVADSGVRWVVDPLDGTVNYLYGLPDWSVSIGAEVNGDVVAGAVSVPMQQSLFSARAGGGAWLPAGGGAPPPPSLPHPGAGAPAAAVSGPPGVPLARALVGTGFGYAAARRAVQGRVVAAVLPQVRDIRRGGSAAVELCSVAAGRLDAYYERGLNPWDSAAGGLIAQEAGARLGGLPGRPAGESMTLAAAPALFTALHDLLVSLDPERDD